MYVTDYNLCGRFTQQRACCTAVAFLILLVQTALATDLGSRNTPLWRPIDWELTNPTYSGNPFDVIGTVTFAHASGQNVQTEMFYNDNNKWAFRFTGTALGTWTFTTTSADPELDGFTGSVEIVANSNPNERGFLTATNNKWVWSASGEAITPQYVMWGGNSGDSNTLKDFRDNLAVVDAQLDEFLSVHGFTGFHIYSIARGWFNIDEPGGGLLADGGEPNPDIRSFEGLENLILATYQRGGHTHLWAWGDQSRGQTPLNIPQSLGGGLNGTIDRRLQRYIAARLGPIPGWSMGYGFDVDEWDPDASNGHAWRNFIQQKSGWFHFLGSRPVGPNNLTNHSSFNVWNAGFDYASYEHELGSFSNDYTYAGFADAVDATSDKPAFSEDRTRLGTRSKDVDVEQTRDLMWLSTMAGGIASIWGDRDPGTSALPTRPYSNKVQLKTYAIFFNDSKRFLADMVRANDRTSDAFTKILYSPASNSYVVYAENTDAIHVDLTTAAEALPVIAVDTRQSYAEIDLGTSTPENHTLTLPYSSNWAVAIGSFTSTSQPLPTLGLTNITDSAGVGGPADDTGGHGAMWADVTGNGLPDLYLPFNWKNQEYPDYFYRNIDGIVFAEEAAARGIQDRDGGSHGAAWADLDNDGDYDLVNGTTLAWGAASSANNIFRNDGSGYFTEVTPPQVLQREEVTRGICTLDIDNDGDLDIFAVSNYLGSSDPIEERNELYRNDGNFNFSPIEFGDAYTARIGQGCTDTDFDGDGDIDILAANRGGAFAILINDGNGNFTQVQPSVYGLPDSSGIAGDGITTADVNNDGALDILLSRDNTSQLYINDGNHQFNAAQTFANVDGYMGGFADMDNDGDLDLAFPGKGLLYLNDGYGNYDTTHSFQEAEVSDPRAVAFADIDDDGDMDMMFAGKLSINKLFRNDLTSGGSWLKIKLISPQGQAGAFGAKVFVYAAGEAESGPILGMREAKSNYGYLAQDDPVLHFGLGNRDLIDVKVTFLGGQEAIFENVDVNQTLAIDGTTLSFNPNPSQPEGLVAYWDFAETAGDIAIDQSGNGYTGTINGATRTTGIVGQALYFDGNNDFVDIGDVLDFVDPASFTLSLWMKAATIDTTDQRTLLAKWEGSGAANRSVRFEIETDKTITLLLDGDLAAKSNTILEANTWYHFAATVNPATDTVAIYINGVQNVASVFTGSIADNIFPWVMGQRSDGEQGFNGWLDEVQIHNRSLSANEIAQLAQPGYSLTYGDWATLRELSGDAALPASDPDGDSISNFEEYAFGGNPLKSDFKETMPVFQYNQNQLEISYRKAAPITLKVERSSNLVEWLESPANEMFNATTGMFHKIYNLDDLESSVFFRLTVGD